MTTQQRDITIDTLRGMAIFTMVAANMAPDGLAEPHPLWFRFYGSFAAPLFILLSGMMVALNASVKDRSLKYFAVRGLMIIAIGVLIDILIMNICPFMTIDVLYLIGLSLPIVYLCLRLNPSLRWVIIIAIFLVTPILQKILGYTDHPTEFYLWGEPTIIAENQTNIFNHWVIDGWFPIFPWLGFPLLGANLAHLRWHSELDHRSFGRGIIFLIGLSIMVLGGLVWWYHPGKLFMRAGYCELFYPPTIGYIATAIGLIMVLFFIVDRKTLFIYKPLQTLGESALFMYIVHLAFIQYVIDKIWGGVNFRTFIMIYIVLAFFLIVLAYGLKALKTKWEHRPFIIRFLLGG